MADYKITLYIDGEDREVKVSDITKAICEQYTDNYPDVFTQFIKTMLKWCEGENYGSEYLKMLVPLYKATVNQLPVETSICENYTLKAAYAVLKEQAREGSRDWRW